MFDLLIEMNLFASEQNKQPTAEQTEPWVKRYRKIINEGWDKNPLPKEPPPKKKRGRRAKTKAQNLLTRLGENEDSALAFLHDINVPFTNNLAERIRIDSVRNEPQSYPVVEQARHRLWILCLLYKEISFFEERAGRGTSRIVFYQGARMH